MEKTPATEHPLPRTVKALKVYDEGKRARSKQWSAAHSDEAVLAALNTEAEALLKVRLAFYEDTKDRNQLNHCLIVDLPFLRGLCEKYANPNAKRTATSGVLA